MAKTRNLSSDTRKPRGGALKRSWKATTRIAVDPDGTRWLELAMAPGWEKYERIRMYGENK